MGRTHETKLDNLDKLHESQPDFVMPEWYQPRDRRISQEQKEHEDLIAALTTVHKLRQMENKVS